VGHLGWGSAFKKGGVELRNGHNNTGSRGEGEPSTCRSRVVLIPPLSIALLFGIYLVLFGATSQTAWGYNQTKGPVLTANFTASTINGSSSLWLSFTDLSVPSDGIVSWYWDFGDNSTSRERNPSHKYAVDGVYQVNLTVRDKDGNIDSETKSVSTIVREDGGGERSGEGEGVTQEGVVVPTDSNISATVRSVKSVFARKDAQGEYPLVEPVSICRDSEGRLLLADSGRHEVFVLDSALEVEAIIGNTTESTIPIFWISSADDLAVDSEGRIYVCDMGFNAVHILGPDFNYLGRVTIPDSLKGVVTCVAIDSRGRLLVGWFHASETGVLVFDVNMSDPARLPTVLNRLVKVGQGDISDIAVDSTGRIVLAEAGSYVSPDTARLIVLNNDLGRMFSIGSHGREPGNFVQPYGVAVGPGDMIIASDAGTSMISFFFANGTYGGRVGKSGSQPGEFSAPTGLLVNSSGDLFVLELWGKRLQQLAVDFSSLRPTEVCEFPVVILVIIAPLPIWRARRSIKSRRQIGCMEESA